VRSPAFIPIELAKAVDTERVVALECNPPEGALDGFCHPSAASMATWLSRREGIRFEEARRRVSDYRARMWAQRRLRGE
jgi:hypothetical protein